MKNYYTKPNKRRAIENLPPDEFRLKHEEIQSKADYDEKPVEISGKIAPSQKVENEEDKASDIHFDEEMPKLTL